MLLLPTHGMRPLKVVTLKKSLFTHEQIDAICKAAFETRTNEKGERVPVTKNAVVLVDYIRLMTELR